ncbi:hypothetical protein [Planctomycetes bacterium K23_9]
MCNSCDGSGCKSCSACPNNGAKIRKVNKLKVKKYECPECKYTWDAEKVGGCCGGNCGTASCADGCCADGCCADGCCGGSCDDGATGVDLSQVNYPPSADVSYAAPMQYEPSPTVAQPMPTAVPAPVYTDQTPPAADYYAPVAQ